ncbi:D-alanyl-D-alanine carboxypeptidase [Candidatus Uhrbacteria bacterium]|nr:D-alanyl-D-alanine carboxypeptidase [Candidatus Uhrbacteria bacterium]
MLLQLASLFAAVGAFLAVQTLHNAPLPASGGPPPLNLRGGAGELPSLSAESVFLADTTEGIILHSKNADTVRPIASITKLMTALALLDKNPDWNGLITFEAQDRRNGDIAYLIPGEQLKVVDAWNLMLTASSNDAAMLLTRSFLGDEAAGVLAMNAKAEKLGLRSLKFADPTGLRAENVGTAREVAALARFSLSHAPIREAVLKSSFQFAPKGKAAREVHATNQLLRWFNPPDGPILGGKTGHIEESKYNLVFAARSYGSELMAVVLGSETNDARFQDMAKLLKWGFSVVQGERSLGD